jgi:hypothetical protein
MSLAGNNGTILLPQYVNLWIGISKRGGEQKMEFPAQPERMFLFEAVLGGGTKYLRGNIVKMATSVT